MGGGAPCAETNAERRSRMVPTGSTNPAAAPRATTRTGDAHPDAQSGVRDALGRSGSARVGRRVESVAHPAAPEELVRVLARCATWGSATYCDSCFCAHVRRASGLEIVVHRRRNSGSGTASAAPRPSHRRARPADGRSYRLRLTCAGAAIVPRPEDDSVPICRGFQSV
jgi:hypothetical protein